jgi:hypothetical protein
MFENPINPFQFSSRSDECCKARSVTAHRYSTALNQFKSVLQMGKLFRMVMKVLGRKPVLFDLNAIKPGLELHGSHYSGLRAVRIHSIIGSEGKCADFDMGFHPVNETARQRWVNMAIVYLSRLPLPAVHLIQIGDAYFVRDGHHRISVARAFGQDAIDAEIVTWKASPPFPWQPDAAAKELRSWKRIDQSA